MRPERLAKGVTGGVVNETRKTGIVVRRLVCAMMPACSDVPLVRSTGPLCAPLTV